MNELRFGDIVAPEPLCGFHLRSGASAYPDAVVISEKPLMLCSRGADMLWTSTIDKVSFKVVGRATADQLKKCMERLPKGA